MEGDDLYSIVVPTYGVTLSLLAGALASSSAPSSNTVPRIPFAENQTIHQVSAVGTRYKNKSSGSPVSRLSPERSRTLELSANNYRRARSKPRSRSKSRTRRKKTSCSPISRKSRPDSRSPKRERRSCSVASTCSKYCGSSSPNRRSPPSRPSSKDRRRKEIESTRTPLESPMETSSRHYGIEAPTSNTKISLKNESDKKITKRLVKSTTELVILQKENPKVKPDVARRKEGFNNTLSEDKLIDIARDSLYINDSTQAPDAKIRRDYGKEDCEIDSKGTSTKKLLPAEAVVNYMTGWLNCMEKIKSFYSDPVDCTGFDACPPLRERMAQHRLKHHTARGFVPHVSTKRYAFEESEPQWTENLQRADTTEIPKREMVDQPVQTKLTLGDLGKIVIKLDKSIKISNDNNNVLKKHRRSTLRSDDNAMDKGSQRFDIDYKKHRLSRLDSNEHVMQYRNNQNGQNINDDNNKEETGFDNTKNKMSKIRNSYSRSRQNSSSKRRSPSDDKYIYDSYKEDKNVNNDLRQQTFDDSIRNQNTETKNQDGLDINNYEKYSIKSNGNNEDDSKDQTNFENDNYITNERKYSIKPNDYHEYGHKNKPNIRRTFRKSQNNNNNNNNNGHTNRIFHNDGNTLSSNNYPFGKQNLDIASGSKFQGNNVTNILNKPPTNMNDNSNELDKNIPLVNDPKYNSIALSPDKNELNEEIQDWLKNVPLFPNISEKDTAVNELLEKIYELSHAPIEWKECEKILEVLVNEHLDKLHAWYPGDKRDQEDYKRNLIKSLIHRIRPIIKQNNNAVNDDILIDLMDDSVESGNTNNKRSKRSSRSKKKFKRERGDHSIRCTISSNIICGDSRVRKKRPSEKYKSEFSQEIYNWLSRYNFLKHDGLQQISTHDLVGILLNRLSPYLDRPYNSTNKLLLKAKIVDILNSLPICIHHSPNHKTQVIKFADELANMLLNIQTQFDIDDHDDDINSSKLNPSGTRRSELIYITNAVETYRKFCLRTQISEQLRQCLQKTMLSDHLFKQNQLTEVLLHCFQLLQSGQKDIAKNAVMKALEESNVIEKDKIIIANSIIGSLEALSAKETIDDMMETKLSLRHSASRLPVCIPEMAVYDTIFAVYTNRSEKEPGLSPLEYNYFEIAIDVIRDWAETIPPPFSKLSKKQKEEFIFELARDILIQNRIEKSNPVSDIEREKFWMFYAYRWFYRFNLFEDLNDAESYGKALCNEMNRALQLRMVTETEFSKKSNETVILSVHSREMRSQAKTEERERKKREKQEARKIRLQERQEAKERKMKEREAKQKRIKEKIEAKQKRSQEKEITSQKRSQEKANLRQKRSQEKEEKKQKRLRERDLKKGKWSGDDSESLISSEETETTQDSTPYEKCTKNCRKFNTIQLDDELPIAPNHNDNSNWKCATLSFQCLHKIPPSLSHLEKTPTSNTPPTANFSSNIPETESMIPKPKDTSTHPFCPPETVLSPQQQLKSNWKEKHVLAQHCPCSRHHKHKHRRTNEESPNLTDKKENIQYSESTKCVQTSSLHITSHNQYTKDFATKNEMVIDKPITVNVMLKDQDKYLVEGFYGQDKLSVVIPPHNSRELASLQKNNMMLDHYAVMKEFIKKYLEYSNSMDNLLIRATFFHLLKIELQKTQAYYKPINLKRQLSTAETLEEELKYINLVSDWLKEMPVEEAFNTIMNKDRIYFVKDLAQNIAKIQLDKIRTPNVLNYNKCLESVIKRYVKQLPLLREEEDSIPAMTDKLINEINKRSCTNCKSSNENIKTEQNITDFLDKHIRCNKEQLKNDELVLDIWAHILVEAVLKNIKKSNEMHVFNVAIESNISQIAAIQFQLELDYAKEIVELFNILPLLDTPIETKVKKIHELAERLLARDIKITKNPNDDHAEKELVQFIEKWMMDLSLNFIEEQNVNTVHYFEDKLNTLNDNYTQTWYCTNNTFCTKLFTESTVMHYGEKDERKSLAPMHLISSIIDKWSQFLPIEGHDKKTVKRIISQTLYQKTCALQANSKMHNNDSIYKHYLEAEIIAQLDELPKNLVLKGDKLFLTKMLVNELMAIKIGSPEKRIGDDYRKALEEVLEDVKPVQIGYQNPSLEMYKRQLTNKFLLENFDFSKHPSKLKYEQKIQLSINKHVENILKLCEGCVNADDIHNKFYSAISKIPAPDKNYLKDEVEYIKTRCEIDDWFDKLPLERTTSSSELVRWDNTLMSLAKAVNDIEHRQGNDDTLHKEILRHLANFPLKHEYKNHKTELAYRLQTLLASSFEARRFVSLEDQSLETGQRLKPLSESEERRKIYRLKLSDVIDHVLSKPKDLTVDTNQIVEIIKQEIIDSFIKYNHTKDIYKLHCNFKKKILESVFQFLDIIKNVKEIIHLKNALRRGNELITEMSKVAKPNDLMMKEEIQELGKKYHVNELFEGLLPKVSGSKLKDINKSKAMLAKKLNEIENSGNNAENTEKIEQEISKAIIEIRAHLTQENINNFIRNVKQSEIIGTSSIAQSNFDRVHVSNYKTSRIPNDMNISNYVRFPEEEINRLRSSSSHTQHVINNYHIASKDQKFSMQLNPSHREFERKTTTLYMKYSSPGIQPDVQSHGSGQPCLKQVPSMGCQILRINHTGYFKSHNDQAVKPQPDNMSSDNGIQQTTLSSNLGQCSCSISDFENCCGRPREMISEETSIYGLGVYQQAQQGCEIQQLTRDGLVFDPVKSYKGNNSLESQQDHVTGQHTRSTQTIAVQIAEQGCVTQPFPQEHLTGQQRQDISNSSPLKVSLPNPRLCQPPNVVESFGALETVSQYNTASGNTSTHLRNVSERVELPLLPYSTHTNAPLPQPADVPHSNKPSFCKAILTPTVLAPERVSTQQSLISQHLEDIHYSHDKSLLFESKESRSSKNNLKLKVKKCCSQKEPHQFRVLSIPEPECTRYDSIGIPKHCRSLSPGHYQLFSPPIQQRQYLYTIKHGRSFYTQVKDHSKQNLHASAPNYYSKQLNTNADGSNEQAQIYRPVATSTETIECCNAEIATCDDGNNFRSDLHVQCIQEHRNRRFARDSCCSSNQRRRPCSGSRHNRNRCSLREGDNRERKTCCCKGYNIDCTHTPVLQYSESVEDFLPTWLPQIWLRLSPRKK